MSDDRIKSWLDARRAALRNDAGLIREDRAQDAHSHLPAALVAIEAVLALHRPESRFVVWGYEEFSFSSIEDAEEFVGHPVEAQEFELCVECKRVEDGAEDNAAEIGYETSLYPCPTRRALEAVIGDDQ